MALVTGGQVVQAAQVIAEEFFMKSLDLPAMHVVGYEGMWGVIQMLVIVYPILYLLPGEDHGHQEDVFDTVAMISNNTSLALVILVYLFSCGTYNATGIAITGALSAVHRTMLDASRTMLIWAFDLFVHYHIDASSKFGETWTPYSFLQLEMSNGADLANFEAVRFVRDLAHKQNSPVLAQLAQKMATTMRSGGKGVFDKVTGLIRDMIERLQAEAEADGGASDLDGHTSALAHYWASLQGAEASEGTSEDAAVEPSEHALGEWSAAVSSLVRAPVRRVRRRVVRRTVRRSTVVVRRRGCVCGVNACACGSAGAVAVR